MVGINSQAGLDLDISELDGILNIECVLIDILGVAELKELAAPRQVEGRQSGKKARIRQKAGPGAIVGIGDVKKLLWIAVFIDANGIEEGVRHTKGKVLV